MPRAYDRNAYVERNAASILKGLAAGLVGGLVASWTMSQSQSLISRAAKQLDGNGDADSGGDGDDGDEPATVKAAESLSEHVLGRELRESEKEPAGELMHYATGAVAGAVYGALVAWQPRLRMGAGLPYGAAVWAIADEIAVPAAGLSEPPTEYPPSTHLSALSAHLVYGATLECVRRALMRG